MKITETRTETVTREVLTEMRCDLCEQLAPGPWDGWAKERFEVARVELKMTTGESYPEGGRLDVVEFDVCPACFRDVLVPFLENKGAKPRKTEVDL